MHEWSQAVEDTAVAPGLQRIDVMSEKMWMEVLEDVCPRRCAPMTAMVPQDFSGMSVEDVLHLGYNQQIACLLALSRQVCCWRYLQNHYVSECPRKKKI
jgi:hypothetical protein